MFLPMEPFNNLDAEHLARMAQGDADAANHVWTAIVQAVLGDSGTSRTPSSWGIRFVRKAVKMRVLDSGLESRMMFWEEDILWPAIEKYFKTLLKEVKRPDFWRGPAAFWKFVKNGIEQNIEWEISNRIARERKEPWDVTMEEVLDDDENDEGKETQRQIPGPGPTHEMSSEVRIVFRQAVDKAIASSKIQRGARAFLEAFRKNPRLYHEPAGGYSEVRRLFPGCTEGDLSRWRKRAVEIVRKNFKEEWKGSDEAR